MVSKQLPLGVKEGSELWAAVVVRVRGRVDRVNTERNNDRGGDLGRGERGGWRVRYELYCPLLQVPEVAY